MLPSINYCVISRHITWVSNRRNIGIICQSKLIAAKFWVNQVLKQRSEPPAPINLLNETISTSPCAHFMLLVEQPALGLAQTVVFKDKESKEESWSVHLKRRGHQRTHGAPRGGLRKRSWTCGSTRQPAQPPEMTQEASTPHTDTATGSLLGTEVEVGWRKPWAFAWSWTFSAAPQSPACGFYRHTGPSPIEKRTKGDQTGKRFT